MAKSYQVQYHRKTENRNKPNKWFLCLYTKITEYCQINGETHHLNWLEDSRLLRCRFSLFRIPGYYHDASEKACLHFTPMYEPLSPQLGHEFMRCRGTNVRTASWKTQSDPSPSTPDLHPFPGGTSISQGKPEEDLGGGHVTKGWRHNLDPSEHACDASSPFFFSIWFGWRSFKSLKSSKEHCRLVLHTPAWHCPGDPLLSIQQPRIEGS